MEVNTARRSRTVSSESSSLSGMHWPLAVHWSVMVGRLKNGKVNVELELQVGGQEEGD